MAVLTVFGLLAWSGDSRAANCMQDAANSDSLGCSAQDFTVSIVDITNISEPCTAVGDSFTFDGTIEIGGGHATRYDVGIYVANNPTNNALSGNNCDVLTLPIPPAPNEETSQDPDDTCGDYNGGALSIPVTGVTASCGDTDQDGKFDIAICSSWAVNRNTTCDAPSDAFPDQQSKCQCDFVATNADVPACGTNADCSDSNQCTDDVCVGIGGAGADLFGCAHPGNSSPCDDELNCTINDVCSDGQCSGETNPCDDENVCTSDSCNTDSDSCVHSPNDNLCDDGIFCTVNDVCSGGSCNGSPNPCNDNNDCTTDSCYAIADVCQNTPNSDPCDDGNSSTIDDTCTDGVCIGQPTGCTTNADCNDNNDCTDDSCDVETHNCSNSGNANPCDDGIFCTINDHCEDGGCFGGDPNPCDDNNDCTFNFCDSKLDQCSNPPDVEASCDDGVFCNGVDQCDDGECVGGTDPCAGPDGDGNCSESCNEETHSCDAPDPDGSSCTDGLFCNGGDTCLRGTCSTHVGDPCTKGAGACTDPSCDEESQECTGGTLPDGTTCDDADGCTFGDTCTDGICAGTPTLLEDFCPWTVVEKEHVKSDVLKINSQTTIEDDICGGIVRIGNNVIVEDDAVSGESTGTKIMRLTPAAIVGNDIVTAGAGAKAKPGTSKLPYTDPAVSSLAPGSVTAKSDASGFYDLSGSHPLASDCFDVRNAYGTVSALLDAMAATDTIAKLSVAKNQTQTIAPTVVGGLNVVDLQGKKSKVARGATLELSGGGDPDTVVMLRASGKFALLASSKLTLTNSLTPEHVLVYVKGKKCLVSNVVEGAGTLLCAGGKLKVNYQVQWNGALFGAGRKLKIADSSVITHTPFSGF